MEGELLIPFALLSPEDLCFSLQLMQLSEIGVVERTDYFEILSTENHGIIYPGEILESTRIAYVQAGLLMYWKSVM